MIDSSMFKYKTKHKGKVSVCGFVALPLIHHMNSQPLTYTYLTLPNNILTVVFRLQVMYHLTNGLHNGISSMK